jgi:hypothetical protein
MAIKAGISYSYISNIIGGYRFPSPRSRESSESLGISFFDDIFIIEEVDENDRHKLTPTGSTKRTRAIIAEDLQRRAAAKQKTDIIRNKPETGNEYDFEVIV